MKTADASTLTTPFTAATSVEKRSLLQRLFARSRPDLAIKALETLFAQHAMAEITPRKVNEVLHEYGLHGKSAYDTCLQVWRDALTAFLADDSFTDEEMAYLLALRGPLDIAEADVMQLEAELVHPRYERALADMLADRNISADERTRLTKLSSALRLSPTIEHELYMQSATALLQRVLDESVSDRRLSPDEQAQFKAIASNLGITPTHDDATQRLLDRYALFWRIENGDLPAVEVPLALQRGETCHFCCQARWLEFRKQTRTTGYYSQGVSFRIARGVYYRVGASRPHRVTTEGLTEIDHGVLYLTSKRVLFDGERRNSSIRLSSLIAFEPYSDGLKLEKGSGRSPYLILDGDAELAAVILARLLAADT